jgi:AcrR family transcriptional regulator
MRAPLDDDLREICAFAETVMRTSRSIAATRPAAPDRKIPRPARHASRRENNKAEKRQRIRAAALMLFSKQGYETTTLRQIAELAQVALGTLSLYAEDKRDLVLLIFNEKISEVIDRASKASLSEADLLEQVTAFFAVFYRDFYKDLTLARIHLQLNFYSGGAHAAEYYAHRARVFACLEELVCHARETGEISTSEDPALIARHIFFLFSAAVRWWIAAQKPHLRTGIDDFRRLLQLQIAGLGPSFEAGRNQLPFLRETPLPGREAYSPKS